MTKATMQKVIEKPILFTGGMVRAILEGRKTQTRRVVKIPYNYNPQHYLGVVADTHVWEGVDKWGGQIVCPYGLVGDCLWVRETWCRIGSGHKARIFYRADGDRPDWIVAPWKPSIFLPRSSSRITLEIKDVRVERLRDISLKDIEREGFTPPTNGAHANEYWREEMFQSWVSGWNKINAKRGYSWDSNPWVWVITFKRVGESSNHPVLPKGREALNNRARVSA